METWRKQGKQTRRGEEDNRDGDRDRDRDEDRDRDRDGDGDFHGYVALLL